MQKKIIDIISQDFLEGDRELVIESLSTINLTHVMAQSEGNLQNTLLSILYLAKGDVDEVIRLTKAAKKDFRDVIYWATLERHGVETLPYFVPTIGAAYQPVNEYPARAGVGNVQNAEPASNTVRTGSVGE